MEIGPEEQRVNRRARRALFLAIGLLLIGAATFQIAWEIGLLFFIGFAVCIGWFIQIKEGEPKED